MSRLPTISRYATSECNANFSDLFEAPPDVHRWPLVAPPPRGATYLDVHGSSWPQAAAQLEAVGPPDGEPAVGDLGVSVGGVMARALGERAGAMAGGRVAGGLRTPASVGVSREGAALLEALSCARCVVINTCADFWPLAGMVDSGRNTARPVTAAASRTRSGVLRSLRPVESVRCVTPVTPVTLESARRVGAITRLLRGRQDTAPTPLLRPAESVCFRGRPLAHAARLLLTALANMHCQVRVQLLPDRASAYEAQRSPVVGIHV